MKYLVGTLVEGDLANKSYDLTKPTIERYASKIDADLVVLTGKGSHHNIGYRKFDIAKDYLGRYDRILFMDCDIIVAKDSPNIFDLIHYDHMGLFPENRFSSQVRNDNSHVVKVFDGFRRRYIERSNEDIFNRKFHNWHDMMNRCMNNYYNSGVVVYSKDHLKVFEEDSVELGDPLYEQAYLNLMILKHDIKIHKLDTRFNRTCHWENYYKKTEDMPDGYYPREMCYFLHATGLGCDKLSQIKSDIAMLKERGRL